MMVLWECGSITEKELGERIHLDSGTLAPLLKRLDKQGLVKRNRPDQNERLLLITLTDAGIAMRENALSVPSIAGFSARRYRTATAIARVTDCEGPKLLAETPTMRPLFIT